MGKILSICIHSSNTVKSKVYYIHNDPSVRNQSDFELTKDTP